MFIFLVIYLNIWYSIIKLTLKLKFNGVIWSSPTLITSSFTAVDLELSPASWTIFLRSSIRWHYKRLLLFTHPYLFAFYLIYNMSLFQTTKQIDQLSNQQRLLVFLFKLFKSWRTRFQNITTFFIGQNYVPESDWMAYLISVRLNIVKLIVNKYMHIQSILRPYQTWLSCYY